MAVTTTCEICGNERVYERSGCPPSTCSEECRKEKLRRYHKAYFERHYATDAAFRERRKAQTKERNRNLSPEKRQQYHENGRVRRIARCEAIKAAKRAGNAERHAQFVERLYAEGYLLVPETAQMIGITVPSLRQCMVHETRTRRTTSSSSSWSPSRARRCAQLPRGMWLWTRRNGDCSRSSHCGHGQ